MDGTRLPPGETRSLAVELERSSEDTNPSWGLELRERNGERGVPLTPFNP
jgi:hypothetical protein